MANLKTMLDPIIKELASVGQNFGSICFHLPNGAIASHVMWVDADDDHIMINTEVDRAKFKAIQANPNVTVMVWKADSPYSYAEVRGRVVETIAGDAGRAHIDKLAQRYTGGPYANPIGSDRVIVKIAPDRQRLQGL